MHLCPRVCARQQNGLKLKTRPKQLIGSPTEAFQLPRWLDNGATACQPILVQAKYPPAKCFLGKRRGTHSGRPLFLFEMRLIIFLSPSNIISVDYCFSIILFSLFLGSSAAFKNAFFCNYNLQQLARLLVRSYRLAPYRPRGYQQYVVL